jgi:hypothetical protein
MTMRLDDLLPPTTASAPAKPTATPRPKSAQQTRPAIPAKFLALLATNAALPNRIAADALPLCADILTLGYLCAASDGPVTSEEDHHLQGWIWSVVDKTADGDSTSFLSQLTAAADKAKARGKQKLAAVTELAERIHASGERKYIQAAATLCGEIVEIDGRLQPGEFATLSAALQGLRIRNIKAAKIAQELIANDAEISELLAELGIEDDTPAEERERRLSTAWSLENARMHVISDAQRRQQMRQRMHLLQKIRDLYREVEQNGR